MFKSKQRDFKEILKISKKKRRKRKLFKYYDIPPQT